MNIVAEGKWLKAETTLHNLRGLSLIADLYIIGGALMAGLSLFLIVFGSFYALILVAAGFILIAIGYYLDDLHRFSWWAVVLSNAISLVTTSYSAIVLQIVIFDVIFVINTLLSALCLGYLLRASVRNLFFEN